MAIACFLKLEGPDLQGEAQAEGHAGEIDVLSWNWGLSQNGTMHQPAGGVAGKASVQDLRLSRHLDAATPKLVLACLAGTQFQRATLACVRLGGDASLPFLTIVMQRVIVRAVDDGGAGGDAQFAENLSLHFAEVIIRYTRQNPDGSVGEQIAIGWSIRENKRLPT
jgi:type VI secretion system secreted protein Hcp